MTIGRLQEVIHAQPFRPFVIHLADGRAVPVLHQEFVAAVPAGRTFVVMQPDESVNIIDPLLVSDLEFKPVTANGKP